MAYARNDYFLKAFGENLQRIRKKKKMSQSDLAYDCDMELSQISRIERGVINTSISNIFLIANALKVSPKELFDFHFEVKKRMKAAEKK